MWHRHPELVWELSAYTCTFCVRTTPSKTALHRWGGIATSLTHVNASATGTRLDRDRRSRQTAWPGEDATEPVEDVFIADRDRRFVAEQVKARRET